MEVDFRIRSSFKLRSLCRSTGNWLRWALDCFKDVLGTRLYWIRVTQVSDNSFHCCRQIVGCSLAFNSCRGQQAPLSPYGRFDISFAPVSKRRLAVTSFLSSNADRTHLKLVVMAFIWASSYPLGRLLGEYEVPSVVVFLRLLVAFAFLVVVARFSGQLEWKITLKQGLLFILLGFSGFCVHNYLMFKALEHTQAGTGAVINGAIPLLVVILDFLVFRKTIGRLALVGIAVGILGTLIVVSHGDLSSLWQKGQGIGFGELLFLIAITGWAIYSIAARPLFQHISPIMITAFTCLAGAILMAPAAIHTLPEAAPLFQHWQLLGAAVLQGVFVVGLGFLWFYEGVKKIGPTRTSVYINLIPIFAIILAAITIGEKPDPSLYVGGGITLLGLFIVNWQN